MISPREGYETVGLDYPADTLRLVGWPLTVADRILEPRKRTGSYRLLMVSHDATDGRITMECEHEGWPNERWPIGRLDHRAPGRVRRDLVGGKSGAA